MLLCCAESGGFAVNIWGDIMTAQDVVLKIKDGLLQTTDVLLTTKEGLLQTEDVLLMTKDSLLKTIGNQMIFSFREVLYPSQKHFFSKWFMFQGLQAI